MPIAQPCEEGWQPSHRIVQCRTPYPDVVTSAMEETEESNDYPHTLRPHCTGEKVRGHQYIHVDTDEFPPGHGLLTFWGGWQTIALEDISYGLIADRIAQVGQSPHNPIIAPRAILSGHPNHESLEVVPNAGTSNRLTRLYTITLLRGKLAVPGQDGVGPDNRRDLSRAFLPSFWPSPARA
jgi:hypothetical protein